MKEKKKLVTNSPKKALDIFNKMIKGAVVGVKVKGKKAKGK